MIAPPVSDKEVERELRGLKDRVSDLQNLARGLVEIKSLGTSRRVKKLTPERAQEQLASLMQSLLLVVDDLLGPQGCVPPVLIDLAVALCDLTDGHNSRLLITGDLIAKFGDNRVSRARISSLVDERVAILILMIEELHLSQRDAARRLSNELGGVTADGLRDALRTHYERNRPGVRKLLENLRRDAERFPSLDAFIKHRISFLKLLHKLR